MHSGLALRETALSAELGVSRNTLREALRQLVAEGLAVQQQHKGVVVETISTSDVEDIYRVREVIELRAVEYSGEASEPAMRELTRAIERAEMTSSEQRWGQVSTASLEFHAAIAGLLESPLIENFFATVIARLRLAFGAASEHQDFQIGWIERDRRIHDLIAAGARESAALALRGYLADSRTMLLGSTAPR